MKKVESRFKNLMLVSVIMAVVDVIVGICLTLYLGLTTHLVAVVVGTVILLHGMFSLIRYIYDGLGKNVFAINLITAVMGIILGTFTIFFQFTDPKYVGVVFGIYLFFNTIEKVSFGIKLRNHNDASYPIVLVIALFLLVMAVFVAFNPFRNSIMTSKLIGIFMLCSGILDGTICKLFHSNAEGVLKMF